MGRRIIVILGCGVLLGCPEDDIRVVPPPTLQADLFAQKDSAMVDILWVIDNSQSMTPIQSRIGARFVDFFAQLMDSFVDYHVGVVTTDAVAETGILRQYGRDVNNPDRPHGDPVPGCAGDCRYISRAIGCENIERSNSCHARKVFENLIHVGNNGANYEQGLLAAAMALGKTDDPETGEPVPIPEANAGFLRSEADLHIIFVSDEDDYSHGRDAYWAARYYTRLFEGVKGPGNENKVTVSAIVGNPKAPDGLEPIALCARWRESGAESQIDFRIGPENSARGCVDTTDPERTNTARVGSKYLEVACNSGGVFASICDGDYSVTLDTLGANAAGLRRYFRLSRGDELELGCDDELGGGDDPAVDCGNRSALEHGDPLCVLAVDLEDPSSNPVPVSRDPQAGYTFDGVNKAIRFNGRFVPAPGTEISVTYKLKTTFRSCAR
jgi:hypothetical protein